MFPLFAMIYISKFIAFSLVINVIECVCSKQYTHQMEVFCLLKFERAKNTKWRNGTTGKIQSDVYKG